MSSIYSVYVGVFIEMESIQLCSETTRRLCPECGNIVTNSDVNYCSYDGSEIETQIYSKPLNVSNMYDLSSNFHTLLMYDDTMWTPEDCKSNNHFIMLSNNETFGYDMSYDNREAYKEISYEYMTQMTSAFKKCYDNMLKEFDNLGLKYMIKFGTVGYWS